MRAQLRKFASDIAGALTRLDAAVRGLGSRVDALESTPPAVERVIERVETVERVIQEPTSEGIQAFVDAWLNENPPESFEIDENAIKTLVEAAVSAWMADNPPRDGDNATPDMVSVAVAAWFVDNPIAVPQPEAVDYARIVADVLSRVVIPTVEPKAVDYDRIMAAIPAPIPGKDGISVTQVEIVGADLLVTYSSGRVKNIGRVVGADGVTTIETRIIPGKDGEDGAGIADITQEGNELVITMTTGEPKRFRLPEPRQLRTFGPGGGGVSESRVLELIAANGTGTAPNTGWAQYLDTQYTLASPFVVSDGSTVTLPNNAGNNIIAYLPEGETLYDPLTQKLTPAAVGDYNAITIRFDAEASSTAAYLEFGIDTGNPAGPIFRDVKVFPKGAGVEHPFTFTCLGFSLNNFTNNGGIVKITAVGGDVEIHDINYHFARLIPA